MSNYLTDLAGKQPPERDFETPVEPNNELSAAEDTSTSESSYRTSAKESVFQAFSRVPPDPEYLVRPAHRLTDQHQLSAALQRIRHRGIKRAFDIAFSIILIIVFLPLMLLFSAVIRMNSPGQAIFVQQRIGRDGISFPCLKFRTMVTDAAEQLEHLLRTDPVAKAEWDRDQKLRNDIRITPMGHFLRKTSLDELPQLFNILVGHMSVVGPRPIVPGEVTRYGIYFNDYCAVRPGLTGLWQIGGRNDVSYDSRVKLDVEYARNRSFAGDIAICCKTLPALLSARGCY